MHSVVVNERSFVALEDDAAHTQSIENVRVHEKRKLKCLFGTSCALLMLTSMSSCSEIHFDVRSLSRE